MKESHDLKQHRILYYHLRKDWEEKSAAAEAELRAAEAKENLARRRAEAQKGEVKQLEQKTTAISSGASPTQNQEGTSPEGTTAQGALHAACNRLRKAQEQLRVAEITQPKPPFVLDVCTGETPFTRVISIAVVHELYSVLVKELGLSRCYLYGPGFTFGDSLRLETLQGREREWPFYDRYTRNETLTRRNDRPAWQLQYVRGLLANGRVALVHGPARIKNPARKEKNETHERPIAFFQCQRQDAYPYSLFFWQPGGFDILAAAAANSTSGEDVAGTGELRPANGGYMVEWARDGSVGVLKETTQGRDLPQFLFFSSMFVPTRPQRKSWLRYVDAAENYALAAAPSGNCANQKDHKGGASPASRAVPSRKGQEQLSDLASAHHCYDRPLLVVSEYVEIPTEDVTGAVRADVGSTKSVASTSTSTPHQHNDQAAAQVHLHLARMVWLFGTVQGLASGWDPAGQTVGHIPSVEDWPCHDMTFLTHIGEHQCFLHVSAANGELIAQVPPPPRSCDLGRHVRGNIVLDGVRWCSRRGVSCNAGSYETPDKMYARLQKLVNAKSGDDGGARAARSASEFKSSGPDVEGLSSSGAAEDVRVAAAAGAQGDRSPGLAWTSASRSRGNFTSVDHTIVGDGAYVGEGRGRKRNTWRANNERPVDTCWAQWDNKAQKERVFDQTAWCFVDEHFARSARGIRWQQIIDSSGFVPVSDSESENGDDGTKSRSSQLLGGETGSLSAGATFASLEDYADDDDGDDELAQRYEWHRKKYVDTPKDVKHMHPHFSEHTPSILQSLRQYARSGFSLAGGGTARDGGSAREGPESALHATLESGGSSERDRFRERMSRPSAPEAASAALTTGSRTTLTSNSDTRLNYVRIHHRVILLQGRIFLSDYKWDHGSPIAVLPPNVAPRIATSFLVPAWHPENADEVRSAHLEIWRNGEVYLMRERAREIAVDLSAVMFYEDSRGQVDEAEEADHSERFARFRRHGAAADPDALTNLCEKSVGKKLRDDAFQFRQSEHHAELLRCRMSDRERKTFNGIRKFFLEHDAPADAKQDEMTHPCLTGATCNPFTRTGKWKFSDDWETQTTLQRALAELYKHNIPISLVEKQTSQHPYVEDLDMNAYVNWESLGPYTLPPNSFVIHHPDQSRYPGDFLKLRALCMAMQFPHLEEISVYVFEASGYNKGKQMQRTSCMRWDQRRWQLARE
eukprot:g6359.t1